MNLNNNYTKIVLSVFSLVILISFASVVSALDATGSEYVIGQLASVAVASTVDGDEYSGSSGSVLTVITNDAQSLETGAVIGITGSAILEPDKIPIINSYSITPNPVNQTSWARIFISAVYTSQILVNITRPDSVIDTISMGSQSVYYYPYTNLIGRYDVLFIAEGNDIVTAEDYFDVIEEEEPYVPPQDDEDDDRSSGGGSTIIFDYNPLYISISNICIGTSGMIIEIANDTSVVPGALVSVKSLDTGETVMNATTDEYGMVEFNLSSGNYTITVSAKNHRVSSRNYELYCEVIESADKGNGITTDSDMDHISGQAVQENLSPEQQSQQSLSGGVNAPNIASASRILDGQSLFFTTSFLVYLAFTSLIFVFAIILLIKLYRRDMDQELVYERNYDNNRANPKVIILENKTLLDKKLMPIEEEIIKIESELQELNHKTEESNQGGEVNKDVDIIDGDLSKDAKYLIAKDETVTVPEKKSALKKNVEVQKTLDAEYTSFLGLSYKKSGNAGLKNKVAKKKSVTSSAIVASNYLSDVPQEHVFTLCNGDRIKNLRELSQKLNNMSKDTFNYHVTNEKNDFASWIETTIGYKDLADAIVKIKSQDKMMEVIDSTIMALDNNN